jgi:predicted acetyltransferase
MDPDSTSPDSQVEVIPATPVQQPIVSNLLELYMHDFSEFHPLDLGPDGRFGYPHLDRYWHDPGKHPFLVKVNGKWAGLVLVHRGSRISGDEDVWDVGEFFIARRHRKRGVGTEIALQIWRRFTGRWEVRVMESNAAALRFWQHAVSRFVGQSIQPLRIETGGKFRQIFAFDSKPAK